MGGVVIKLTLGFRSVLPTRRMKRRAFATLPQPILPIPLSLHHPPIPIKLEEVEGRTRPASYNPSDTAVGP